MRTAVILALAVALPLSAAAAQPSGRHVEAVEGYMARARAVDGKVGAILRPDPTALDQAREADRRARSRGLPPPLNGKAILIKDNIDVAGMPNTGGSLALKDNLPKQDAPLVARLREAGVVILGKSNLSEWANIRSSDSVSGWSAVGGQTRNPYDPARSPCGSSSGSGAAVAAGLAWAAIGTETDGSITCPASVSGLVGLKPTVGLVSRTGVIPISASQDTAGPMATSVQDAAELLSAMAGSDPADPATKEADSHRRNYALGLSTGALRGQRIGVMRYAAGFHGETDAAFEAALQVLRDQGAILIDIKDFPNRAEAGNSELVILLTELKVGMADYLATTDPTEVQVRTLADVIAFNKVHAAEEMALFGQDLFEQAEKTGGLQDPAYLEAKATADRVARGGLDRLLKDNNVVALVGPTLGPSWLIDPILGDRYVGGGAGNAAAVAGYPHLTVPMGLVRGMPVGLSFVGPKWSEATLLTLGYAYEQASKARVPPKL
ncbi:amidase [Caulobacter sp. NIBR1757]|uniref:amidase n=1 Tax=Caulobacter sp. NIBR1757 TaxID=3016000 RepID=UPI0022F044E3|nr:amidase [Caulobacter sp. NIBR1757]WGM38694.1 Glutamyl-tRNA(Gln) amidotransferase subunit A [Caulobacter sp. NIBR1757]